MMLNILVLLADYYCTFKLKRMKTQRFYTEYFSVKAVLKWVILYTCIVSLSVFRWLFTRLYECNTI